MNSEECFKRQKALIKSYKQDIPSHVSPLWDISANCVKFNDINNEIVASGISIYEAKFIDVWNGIFEPKIYRGETLWKKLHDSSKIAQVIENWDNCVSLSPIFLVKHGAQDLGLVADGKHRLTVSHYCLSEERNDELYPFMVGTKNSEWLSNAIPTAKLLYQY